MIFVLLTNGGWNEAAYLSAEVEDAPRNMARVLLLGTAPVIAICVLVNLALLSELGLGGLRMSKAVAADMMQAVTGEATSMATGSKAGPARRPGARHGRQAAEAAGARVRRAGRGLPGLCAPHIPYSRRHRPGCPRA